MRKLSFKQAAAGIARTSAKTAGKVARASTRQALAAGKKVMHMEVPDSLNWLYGFGFKAGVFLILKSFLILRYQAFNLNFSGFTMIIVQFIQALALISCGALMQNKGLYDDPIKLRKISHYYGYSLFIGVTVFIMRETFDWNFFKQPKAVNWFIDFFAGISKEAGEISLSLLFWDFDLWSTFCGLLYFVTVIYLHVSFEYTDGIFAAVSRKMRTMKNLSLPGIAFQTTEHVNKADDDIAD